MINRYSLTFVERFSYKRRKVIGLHFRRHTISLKYSRHFSSNQKKNQNKQWRAYTHFPALRVSYI